MRNSSLREHLSINEIASIVSISSLSSTPARLVNVHRCAVIRSALRRFVSERQIYYCRMSTLIAVTLRWSIDPRLSGEIIRTALFPAATYRLLQSSLRTTRSCATCSSHLRDLGCTHRSTNYRRHLTRMIERSWPCGRNACAIIIRYSFRARADRSCRRNKLAIATVACVSRWKRNYWLRARI